MLFCFFMVQLQVLVLGCSSRDVVNSSIGVATMTAACACDPFALRSRRLLSSMTSAKLG